MAQEIVDFTLDHLPEERRGQAGPSNTKIPLNPLASIASFQKARALVEQKQWPISTAEVKMLVERHGLEFLEIIDSGIRAGYSSMYEFEALHAIRTTMCLHLDDFYIRRVPLFLANKNHGLEFRDKLIAVFAKELGWTEQQCRDEAGRLEAHMKHEMGWRHH
jgi:glycerol-3-phosphate dehydrogenase